MRRADAAERDWRKIDALRARRPKLVRGHRTVAEIDARLQALILRRLRAEIRENKRNGHGQS
jgi:hypothetical protein